MNIIVMDNGTETIVDVDTNDKVVDIIDKLPRRGLIKFGDNILDNGMYISDTGITSDCIVSVVGDCDKCDDYVIASERGHLECLKIAWDCCDMNKSHYALNAAYAASVGGHFECLKFIVNENINEDTKCNSDLIYEFDDCPDHELFESAMEGKNLDCIKLVHNIGTSLPYNIYRNAVETDDLDIVKYIIENCEDDESDQAFELTLSEGKRDILQCLHEHDVSYDKDVILLDAMFGGNIECVKYVVEVMNETSEIDTAYEECEDEEIKEYLDKHRNIME